MKLKMKEMFKKIRIWLAKNWPNKVPKSWCEEALNAYWKDKGIDGEKKRTEMFNNLMKKIK